jgi:hypothetical protein
VLVWSRCGLGFVVALGNVRRSGVFKFLLRLEDGEPPDPAVLVTAVPNWTVGETFSTGRGDEWRILAVDYDVDVELVDRGLNAVFTVEPA